MAPGLLTEQNQVTAEQLVNKVEKIKIDKKDNLYDDKENGWIRESPSSFMKSSVKYCQISQLDSAKITIMAFSRNMASQTKF